MIPFCACYYSKSRTSITFSLEYFTIFLLNKVTQNSITHTHTLIEIISVLQIIVRPKPCGHIVGTCNSP